MTHFKIILSAMALSLPQISIAQTISMESCFPFTYSDVVDREDIGAVSKDELTAVLEYTVASGGVNRFLRFGSVEGVECEEGMDVLKCKEKSAKRKSCLEAQVNLIDSALKKIQTKSPAENKSRFDGYIKVFRGTHQYAPFISKKLPGEIINLKGLTSTSYSKDVAEGFMPIFGVDGKIDKQTRLVEIHTFSGAEIPSNVGYEREVLIPHNTKFEIIRVETMTATRTNYEDMSEHEVEFEYLVLKEVMGGSVK